MSKSREFFNPVFTIWASAMLFFVMAQPAAAVERLDLIPADQCPSDVNDERYVDVDLSNIDPGHPILAANINIEWDAASCFETVTVNGGPGYSVFGAVLSGPGFVRFAAVRSAGTPSPNDPQTVATVTFHATLGANDCCRDAVALAPGSGPSATILAGEGGYSSVPELGDAVILSTYTENSVVSCEPELFDCNTNDVPDLCDIVYMSSTDIDDNDQPDDCQPRVVVAVSRKSHGGAGEFDVDATSGDSEPRAAGVTRLIVTFDQEVFAVGGPSTDDVSVSHGMVTSVDQLGTDLLEVLMTMGGADKVCLLVDFPGIENIDGFQVADMLQVPVIQGDINNDGLSGVADATSANATGAVTDDAEARGDLDLDGFRGPSDEAAAKIASSPIATACP